jgi:hypothetical protein
MPHLIDHLDGPLVEVREALELRRRQLAVSAKAIALRLAELPVEGWGIAAKRIAASTESQPFGELLNQLATVERLVDALIWAEGECPPSTAVSVNPTTSFRGSDLVVQLRPRWYFEVCDVTRPGNSNGKLDRDLRSLTAVSADLGARQFLVVSAEWTTWLSRQPARFWESRGWRPTQLADMHAGVGLNGTGVLEMRRSFD